jgi:hypothetical protein
VTSTLSGKAEKVTSTLSGAHRLNVDVTFSASHLFSLPGTDPRFALLAGRFAAKLFSIGGSNMADEALIFLAKDVRGKTLQLLDSVSDEQARWAPAGLENHILWHAGHALVVVEHLGLSAATGKPPGNPPGWFELFGWNSKPASVVNWPTRSEVRARLVNQIDRLTESLTTMTDQQLKVPVADQTNPARGREIRWSILHSFHDEANHQGEMWLLSKLRTKANR